MIFSGYVLAFHRISFMFFGNWTSDDRTCDTFIVINQFLEELMAFCLFYLLDFAEFYYVCHSNCPNRKNMLVYNTTYHVEMDDARNFIIWLNECYIPEAEREGELKNPRILRILSHKEEDSECFSLQWEVEDSAALHRWLVKKGERLNWEIKKVFKDKVVGFPTLMEIVR